MYTFSLWKSNGEETHIYKDTINHLVRDLPLQNPFRFFLDTTEKKLVLNIQASYLAREMVELGVTRKALTNRFMLSNSHLEVI